MVLPNGYKNNSWTLVKDDGTSRKGDRVAQFRCVCGKEFTRSIKGIVEGNSRQCRRCSYKNRPSKPSHNRKYYVGQILECEGRQYHLLKFRKDLMKHTGRGARFDVRCPLCGNEDWQPDIYEIANGLMKGCSKCQCGRLKYPDSEANLRECYRGYLYEQRTGIDFLLTFEQFSSIVLSPCHYCGLNPCRPYRTRRKRRPERPTMVHGVDRKYSNGSYNMENVVTCCTACNFRKNGFINMLTPYGISFDEYEEFLCYIRTGTIPLIESVEWVKDGYVRTKN
jgi:hypothetical protein